MTANEHETATVIGIVTGEIETATAIEVMGDTAMAIVVESRQAAIARGTVNTMPGDSHPR